MNAVLGRIASTAQELAHYHSGDGTAFLSSFLYSSVVILVILIDFNWPACIVKVCCFFEIHFRLKIVKTNNTCKTNKVEFALLVYRLK